MNIYAYWDQPAHIPAYLQLCVATWRRYGCIDEVFLISNDNLAQWIGEDTLDLGALQAYPVPQRKDAIEIAILARYGGLFIDVDTLCTAPLKRIQVALADYDIALYGFHMAAVAARRDSDIVARWLALLQQTLVMPREQIMATTGLDYTELGNYCFELLRNELATGIPAVPGKVLPRFTRLLRKLQRHRLLRSPRQRFITQLDPADHGYIVERNHRRGERLSASERYRDFWFSSELPLSAATGNAGALVALHHSWTPAAYCQLGFEELNQDDALLSRYLRSLLGSVDDPDLAIFNRHNPEES